MHKPARFGEFSIREATSRDEKFKIEKFEKM